MRDLASKLHLPQTGGKARSDERHYVLVKGNGKEDGDYKSRSGPSGAARKAARRLFSSSVTKVRVTIRETGTKKTFTYDVTRVKLPKPLIRKIKGVEIRNEYTTKIKAVKG